jgi:hypothetical protein
VRALRLLLKLYPTSFRERFGEEIEADFEDGAGDWLDLAVSIIRERRMAGTTPTWPLLLGGCLATPIGYLDLRASEVQGIVVFLVVGAGLWGLLWPRRAWRWALVFGLSVPLWHLGNALAGRPSPYPVEPNSFATLLAFVPAAIAAYGGAGIRAAMTELRS